MQTGLSTGLAAVSIGFLVTTLPFEAFTANVSEFSIHAMQMSTLLLPLLAYLGVMSFPAAIGAMTSLNLATIGFSLARTLGNMLIAPFMWLYEKLGLEDKGCVKPACCECKTPDAETPDVPEVPGALKKYAENITKIIVKCALEALINIPIELAKKLQLPAMEFYVTFNSERMHKHSMVESKNAGMTAFMTTLKSSMSKKDSALVERMKTFSADKLEIKNTIQEKGKELAKETAKEIMTQLKDTMTETICELLEEQIEKAGSMAVKRLMDEIDGIPGMNLLPQGEVEEIANGRLLALLMPTIEERVGELVDKVLGGEEEEDDEEEEDEDEEEVDGLMSPIDAWRMVEKAAGAKMDSKQIDVELAEDGSLVKKVTINVDAYSKEEADKLRAAASSPKAKKVAREKTWWEEVEAWVDDAIKSTGFANEPEANSNMKVKASAVKDAGETALVATGAASTAL